ncbi:MAG TPA: hypothetical protein VNA89_06180 [Gemmatimonadaceae bacterium]|nr:hypothetical protein [Gemmatimonadaceae bacterium]
MSDGGGAAAPPVTGRRVGPALVALLFGAAALSELAQLAAWATGDNAAPTALNLARVPAAAAAAPLYLR